MRTGTATLPCLLVLMLCAQPATAEDRAAKAFLAGDLKTTQRLLAEEIAKTDARPSRYLLLGRVYFMQQQWTRAHQLLTQLLTQDPGNPHGVELMARTLYQLGRHAEAITFFERTIRETHRPDLRLEYAESLIALGKPTQALRLLKQIVKEDKAFPRAHYLLGKLRLEAGQGHWAAQQLLIAQRLGAPEPDTDILLAHALHAEGRITGPLTLTGPVTDGRRGQMLKQHILVTPADPGRPNVWHAAASDTALYQIEEAIVRRKPDAPPALHILAARCWLAAGFPAPAGRHLESIDKKTPETDLLRIDLALALNQQDEALRRISEAAQTSPEPCILRCLRGALSAQIEDDHSLALRYLDEAGRIGPGRSDALRLRVDVLRHLGRHEEAGKARTLLLELHPDSPDVELLSNRTTRSPQR